MDYKYNGPEEEILDEDYVGGNKNMDRIFTIFGLGLSSLVLSVLSSRNIIAVILAIITIVLTETSNKDVKTSKYYRLGKIFALIGFVLGIIFSLFGCLWCARLGFLGRHFLY